MNTHDVKTKIEFNFFSMFIQILMEYFLEVTGIKKSTSGEGKHVIFLYN